MGFWDNPSAYYPPARCSGCGAKLPFNVAAHMCDALILAASALRPWGKPRIKAKTKKAG